MPPGPTIFPQPQPIPTPVAWGAPTTQSQFSNLASYQPVAPYATAVDTPGCYWDIPNVVTLAANATYNIPYGTGYLVTGAVVNSAVLQIQVGSLGNWVTLGGLATNDFEYYDSDFDNVRILNGGAGTTVITLYPKRSR
jgi:hypothetical protein